MKRLVAVLALTAVALLAACAAPERVRDDLPIEQVRVELPVLLGFSAYSIKDARVDGEVLVYARQRHAPTMEWRVESLSASAIRLVENPVKGRVGHIVRVQTTGGPSVEFELETLADARRLANALASWRRATREVPETSGSPRQ